MEMEPIKAVEASSIELPPEGDSQWIASSSNVTNDTSSSSKPTDESAPDDVPAEYDLEPEPDMDLLDEPDDDAEEEPLPEAFVEDLFAARCKVSRH